MLRVFIFLVLPIFISAFITTYNLPFVNNSPFKTLLRRDYTAFTCWLSCAERAAIMCFYLGYKDTGTAARPSSFTFDPAVDRSCQQLTTNAYSNGYDRGHMVAANHMDHTDTTIKESMHMTNIMPQTSTLNQQAWLAAEDIFECTRDVINLNTIVGIIMGTNTANDIFVTSHGVRTPDYYWRIIEKQDGDVISWIMPNDGTATKPNLDKYLVKISEIESRSGFTFTGFTATQKNKLATTSWSIPVGCDKGKRNYD